MVFFRAGTTDYAVAVDRVTEVSSGDEIVPLPAPRPGVVGLLPIGQETVTVVDSLGSGGSHVLLLNTSHETGHAFGLLVDEVTGVRQLEGPITDPPRGQARECISGVFNDGAALVLVVDVDALDERLGT